MNEKEYHLRINQSKAYLNDFNSYMWEEYNRICGIAGFAPHSTMNPEKMAYLENHYPKTWKEAVKKMKIAFKKAVVYLEKAIDMNSEIEGVDSNNPSFKIVMGDVHEPKKEPSTFEKHLKELEERKREEEELLKKPVSSDRKEELKEMMDGNMFDMLSKQEGWNDEKE